MAIKPHRVVSDFDSDVVQTTGVNGPSLVLGQIALLPSNAVHVADGSNIDNATANGPLRSSGAGVDAVFVGPASRIGTLCASDGIHATGLGAQPTHNEGSLTLACPAN